MQPPILTLDENTLKDEIRDLVRGTVEEAVNGILDALALSAKTWPSPRPNSASASSCLSRFCSLDDTLAYP